MQNVEFFGMRLELKAFLGRYYRQWLKPTTPQEASSSQLVMEDSDDEDSRSESGRSDASSISAPSNTGKSRHGDHSPRHSPPSIPPES